MTIRKSHKTIIVNNGRLRKMVNDHLKRSPVGDIAVKNRPSITWLTKCMHQNLQPKI
jgi:hypothetical protein